MTDTDIERVREWLVKAADKHLALGGTLKMGHYGMAGHPDSVLTLRSDLHGCACVVGAYLADLGRCGVVQDKETLTAEAAEHLGINYNAVISITLGFDFTPSAAVCGLSGGPWFDLGRELSKKYAPLPHTPETP